LAGDVLAAAKFAKADIVVVMDGDLSHPASQLRNLVQPIFDGTRDMVVGSRYVPGGDTPDWPGRRRTLSRLGGALAWPLTDLKDPMSGFFAVRKARLLAVDPQATGFKIGLEIIAEGGDALRLAEVPIIFRDPGRRRCLVLSGVSWCCPADLCRSGMRHALQRSASLGWSSIFLYFNFCLAQVPVW
jgi:dolichol-phosphate mannosyltransferase